MIDDNLEIMPYPRVTIGIPTFNNSSTILETLKSVVNQTYPNLEVIVSNDCSTDETVSVISKFMSSFGLIQLINQPVNIGLYENMSFLVSNCESPYFMWLAGDDYISEDFVMNNVKFLEQNPDFVASSSMPAYVRAGIPQIGNPIELSGDKTRRIENFLRRTHSSHNVFYSLFRTEVGKNYPFLGARYAAADWVFDLYLICNGKVNTSAAGYIFLGTNGVSRTANANRKFRSTRIENLFPMWPMSRDMLRISGLELSQHGKILIGILKFNYVQLKSDLLPLKKYILTMLQH